MNKIKNNKSSKLKKYKKRVKKAKCNTDENINIFKNKHYYNTLNNKKLEEKKKIPKSNKKNKRNYSENINFLNEKKMNKLIFKDKLNNKSSEKMNNIELNNKYWDKKLISNKINIIKNKMDIIKTNIIDNKNSINVNFNDLFEKLDSKFNFIINSISKIKIDFKNIIKYHKNNFIKEYSFYNKNYDENLEKLNSLNSKLFENNINKDLILSNLKNIENFTNLNKNFKINLSLELNEKKLKILMNEIKTTFNLKENNDVLNITNSQTVQNSNNKIYLLNDDSSSNLPLKFNKIITPKSKSKTKSLNINENLIINNFQNKNYKDIHLNTNHQYFEKNSFKFNTLKVKNKISKSKNNHSLEKIDYANSNSKFIKILDKINQNQHKNNRYYKNIINNNNINNEVILECSNEWNSVKTPENDNLENFRKLKCLNN